MRQRGVGRINPTPSPQTERRFAPVIGVTASLNPEPNAQVGVPVVGVRGPDIDAVRRAGGIAILMPPVVDLSDIDRLLDRVDGLVFTGGPDIDPREYGEVAINETVEPAPEVDAFELPLMRRAIERDVPILALCRGCQVLGVAMGGALWQDLPSQRGIDILHRQYQSKSQTIAHGVAVVPGTKLHDVLELGPETDLRVNSLHHQAVRVVPAGLVASAHAPDGCIEALEMPERRFVVGVQWHPEFLDAEHEVHHRLFKALVEASRNHAMARPLPRRT